jgi:hypothetical protein
MASAYPDALLPGATVFATLRHIISGFAALGSVTRDTIVPADGVRGYLPAVITSGTGSREAKDGTVNRALESLEENGE